MAPIRTPNLGKRTDEKLAYLSMDQQRYDPLRKSLDNGQMSHISSSIPGPMDSISFTRELAKTIRETGPKKSALGFLKSHRLLNLSNSLSSRRILPARPSSTSFATEQTYYSSMAAACPSRPEKRPSYPLPFKPSVTGQLATYGEETSGVQTRPSYSSERTMIESKGQNKAPISGSEAAQKDNIIPPYRSVSQRDFAEQSPALSRHPKDQISPSARSNSRSEGIRENVYTEPGSPLPYSSYQDLETAGNTIISSQPSPRPLPYPAAHRYKSRVPSHGRPSPYFHLESDGSPRQRMTAATSIAGTPTKAWKVLPLVEGSDYGKEVDGLVTLAQPHDPQPTAYPPHWPGSPPYSAQKSLGSFETSNKAHYPPFNTFAAVRANCLGHLNTEDVSPSNRPPRIQRDKCTVPPLTEQSESGTRSWQDLPKGHSLKESLRLATLLHQQTMEERRAAYEKKLRDQNEKAGIEQSATSLCSPRPDSLGGNPFAFKSREAELQEKLQDHNEKAKIDLSTTRTCSGPPCSLQQNSFPIKARESEFEMELSNYNEKARIDQATTNLCSGRRDAPAHNPFLDADDESQIHANPFAHADDNSQTQTDPCQESHDETEHNLPRMYDSFIPYNARHSVGDTEEQTSNSSLNTIEPRFGAAKAAVKAGAYAAAAAAAKKAPYGNTRHSSALGDHEMNIPRTRHHKGTSRIASLQLDDLVNEALIRQRSLRNSSVVASGHGRQSYQSREHGHLEPSSSVRIHPHASVQSTNSANRTSFGASSAYSHDAGTDKLKEENEVLRALLRTCLERPGILSPHRETSQ